MTNLRLISRLTGLSSVLMTIAVVRAAASGAAQEASGAVED